MSFTLLKTMGALVAELSAAVVVLAWLHPPFPEHIREMRIEERKPLAEIRDRRKAKEKEQLKQQMAWLRTHFPRHFQAQVAELTRRGFEVDDATLEVRKRGVQWPAAVRAREEAQARAAQYKDGGDPDAELDWAEVEVAQIAEFRRMRRRYAQERAAWRQSHPDEADEDDDEEEEEEEEDEAASGEMLSSAVSKLKPPTGWTPSLRSPDRAPAPQGRGAPAGGRQPRSPDTEDELSDDSGSGTDSDE